MNSKELAQVIQAERDKREVLTIELNQLNEKIAELTAQKIRLDNDETDKFISDHFKIISY
jgi:phage shock protein A